MKNEIRVFGLDSKSEKFLRKIKATALKILDLLKKTGYSAEIFIITGKEMAKINEATRGKKGSTNILSFPEIEHFPHPEEKRGRKFLGEIYLDLSLSQDFHFKKGKPNREDLISINHLLCHGLLHLLGYVHDTEINQKKMESKEKLILKQLQIVSK